jgi:protein O-mannosyl-transferase
MKKVKPSRVAAVKVVADKTEVSITSQNLFWLIVIPVSVFMIYSSVINFDMTNWDEKRYLKETPMVWGLSSSNIEKMFTTKVLNSYNPLVILSFAVDHKISNLNPGWCHRINLYFHILNTLLLFLCLKKLNFKIKLAGIISLLFALHPLAVEAVAWIASRKDVMYTFFYFLSWMSYIHYRTRAKNKYYFFSIFFFILSLLSKVQAITFPLLLLITDYILTKKIKRNDVINKIPFFLLSVAFGFIAIYGSRLVADKYAPVPDFIHQLLYSLMATGLYFFKTILPIHLSAINPFPLSGTSEWWLYLILGIAAAIILIWGMIYCYRRAPLITAGLAFFSIHIFVALHIFAVNSALIYERFNYVSAIGLFISAVALDSLYPAWKSHRKKILLAALLVFSFLTWQRIGVWRNSETLWTDVLEKEPSSTEAYNNRGQYYQSKNEFDKALLDFNEAIRINPNKPDAFNNRCVIHFQKKEWAQALLYSGKVLEIDSDHMDGNMNRGSIYFSTNRFDSAIWYYGKVIKLSPLYSLAYYDRAAAFYKTNRLDEAIADFKKAIEIYPDYADAYAYLALSYVQSGRDDEVEPCVARALKANRQSDAPRMVSMEYIHQGNVAFEKGDADKALEYYTRSTQILPGNAEGWYNIGGIFFTRKDLSKSREYWRKALAADPSHAASREWLLKTGGL